MLLETILWILFFCFVVWIWYLLLNMCCNFCNKEKELMLPD